MKGMLEREPKRNSIHLVPYSPQPMIVEKCEAAHRHSGKDRYPAAVDSGESADGQFRTGSFAVIHRHATAQDDQSCHGADDDRVHEYFKDTEEALLYRLLRIGTGVGDGSGTKTGFVGEDTAGYALFHAHEEASHHTAGDRGGIGKHLL